METKKQIGAHATEIKRLDLQILATKIIHISDDKHHPAITLVPKIAKLINPATKVDSEAGKLAEKISIKGCTDAEMTVPAYMRKVKAWKPD